VNPRAEAFNDAIRRAFHHITESVAIFKNGMADWDAETKALANDSTYWVDHQGQPRRIKHRKPLLHKGRKP
jgi:hypothetical protein